VEHLGNSEIRAVRYKGAVWIANVWLDTVGKVVKATHFPFDGDPLGLLKDRWKELSHIIPDVLEMPVLDIPNGMILCDESGCEVFVRWKHLIED
jgi:hypothetical protein